MANSESAAQEVVVTFEREGKSVTVRQGSILRDVADANGINPYKLINRFLNCGGQGECGTCVVDVVSGIEHCSEPNRLELLLLARRSPPVTWRLSCQVKLSGPVTIRTRPVAE
jgi:ferredoxin